MELPKVGQYIRVDFEKSDILEVVSDSCKTDRTCFVMLMGKFSWDNICNKCGNYAIHLKPIPILYEVVPPKQVPIASKVLFGRKEEA